MFFSSSLIVSIIASTYEVAGSYMRGLGYSLTPMLLTVFGTCVLRLGWVGIFRSLENSFDSLLSIYPISWIATGVAVMVAAAIVQRKVFRRASVSL